MPVTGCSLLEGYFLRQSGSRIKKVTAISPLQYQKAIRLQTARCMLLSEGLEAAAAGFLVGYESPPQFSREYSRMFGRTPMNDMKKLCNSLSAPVE